jgi:hypothetical protein
MSGREKEVSGRRRIKLPGIFAQEAASIFHLRSPPSPLEKSQDLTAMRAPALSRSKHSLDEGFADLNPAQFHKPFVLRDFNAWPSSFVACHWSATPALVTASSVKVMNSTFLSDFLLLLIACLLLGRPTPPPRGRTG